MSQARSEKMNKVVALCKRRGFLFQSSEIYGGINGFWDYGPLGVELKRNVRDAWWHDMITRHNNLMTPAGAPQSFNMVGVETSIIMHPQVWKNSGHFDLFCDMMVDCKKCRSRYRVDHVNVAVLINDSTGEKVAADFFVADPETGIAAMSRKQTDRLEKHGGGEKCHIEFTTLDVYLKSKPDLDNPHFKPTCPKQECKGELTAPREFNLMFKTTLGALGGEEDAAFLRPETAQGMFVNFKNVVDSSRVKIPFGIAQIGKSFRNEITPRNFTFRSREFEQMEMEFFCHPKESFEWYTYWRDRRYNWYIKLGISKDNLILREHSQDELAHYSVGTADLEYAFPFLDEGKYGELEGVAHRGDFDLRSHMEGKLVKNSEGQLVPELTAEGQPKYRGSGKDLNYFDDQTRERFVPHVIEPAAGCDRATLAFLCEAYFEDQQPDEDGKMQERVMMKLHPKLAPVKAAIFPLIKKDGMPEKANELYMQFKEAGISAQFDQQAAIGRRYRRQDEIGTPFCITIDGDTMSNGTVTIRDRDTLKQDRLPMNEVLDEVLRRMRQA
jgi:glycyl-tRNA synthetase